MWLNRAYRCSNWPGPPLHGQRSLAAGQVAAKVVVAGLLCATALLIAGCSGQASSQRPSVASTAILSTTAASDDLVSHKRAPAAGQAATNVLPFGSLISSVLAADRPQTVTGILAPEDGGTVVAGNIGLSFSPKALFEVAGNASIHVEARPTVNVPGGPVQFSPDGSIVDISVRDGNGQPVTTFPEPVDILVRYNSADLAMTHGEARALRAAYILNEDSPAVVNPNHFPVGTWVFVPPSSFDLDTKDGTLAVRTQALGMVFSAVGVSVGVAQTVRDSQLYSGFNPGDSIILGTLKQGTYVRMVEPQIGTRLLVLNNATGNYAYMNVRDLRPS
jgi:hypothetical protein